MKLSTDTAHWWLLRRLHRHGVFIKGRYETVIPFDAVTGIGTHALRSWCRDNIPDRWIVRVETRPWQYVVAFKTEGDRILFALRWTEEIAPWRRAVTSSAHNALRALVSF